MREHVLSSHTIQVSLSVVVAVMTKKIKRMKRDLEKQEAIFATHAHRVIRIDLQSRGETGSPDPDGIIGNTGPLGEVGPHGEVPPASNNNKLLCLSILSRFFAESM